MKHIFSLMLIPDNGDAVRLETAYDNSVTAQAAGKTFARDIFNKFSEINSIEAVILEGNEMFSGMSLIHRRGVRI